MGDAIELAMLQTVLAFFRRPPMRRYLVVLFLLALVSGCSGAGSSDSQPIGDNWWCAQEVARGVTNHAYLELYVGTMDKTFDGEVREDDEGGTVTINGTCTYWEESHDTWDNSYTRSYDWNNVSMVYDNYHPVTAGQTSYVFESGSLEKSGGVTWAGSGLNYRGTARIAGTVTLSYEDDLMKKTIRDRVTVDLQMDYGSSFIKGGTITSETGYTHTIPDQFLVFK
jgi:hypothetical protein